MVVCGARRGAAPRPRFIAPASGTAGWAWLPQPNANGCLDDQEMIVIPGGVVAIAGEWDQIRPN